MPLKHNSQKDSALCCIFWSTLLNCVNIQSRLKTSQSTYLKSPFQKIFLEG